MVRVEELKLLSLSDKEGDTTLVNNGSLINDFDPLIRLHGEYVFDLEILDIKAFAGVHTRSGYDIGDGYYVGSEFTFGWFPLSAVLALDSTYLTIQPRFRFLFLELEAGYKIAVSDEEEGFAVDDVLHANFRIAF